MSRIEPASIPWYKAPLVGALHGSLRHQIGTVLMYLVIIEASLFGSGRMLEVGPVTLKMILFALTLLYTTASLMSLEGIQRSTILLTISYAAILVLCVITGAAHSAKPQLISDDLSPLLSFFILPFFELTICSERSITLSIRLIVCSGLLIVAGYIALMSSLWLRALSFNTLYTLISEKGSDDFVFEPNSSHIFYKGSLFIGIALIFMMFKKGRKHRLISVTLLLGLVMVASRGLFLSLALSTILYVMIGPLSTVKKLVSGFVLLLALGITLPIAFSLSGDKTESNSVRLLTISQVIDSANLPSLIIGHGFGVGVPERPEHMEISYLEIFHKQGIVGLLWWASLITLLAARLRAAVSCGTQELVYPLFLSATFILFESATNPFVNNPIGMYPFAICFVSLGVLSRDAGVPKSLCLKGSRL